jgi:hypothetical protein
VQKSIVVHDGRIIEAIVDLEQWSAEKDQQHQYHADFVEGAHDERTLIEYPIPRPLLAIQKPAAAIHRSGVATVDVP